MEIILITASKYIFMLFMALYTLYGFLALKKKEESEKKGILIAGKFFLYAIHFVGNGVIYLSTKSDTVLLFYGCQLIIFVIITELFPVIYPRSRRDLLNHIGMLLNISFLMLTRLSMDRSVRQFKFLTVTTILFFLIPWIYKKIKRPEKLLWMYFAAGFLSLSAVLVLATVTGGAKLSLDFGFITIQPSEFVKITYVFMIAACFVAGARLKNIIFAGILAGIQVIVLVLSTDLGAALILFVAFLFLVYQTSGKKIYLLIGGVGGSAAAVLAWRLFSHIQVRVLAWLDPFADTADTGYQMAQSLFAIGSGKWMGTGLYQGLPNSIPIVYKDFTFSAIAEEFGGFFAICLMFLYLNIFIVIMQIGLEQRDKFRKYVCTGLAVVFEMQTFLTIGGAIKLIPSTGVTLPLISYGGSSMMSMMFIFALIEAIYGKGAQEVNEERRNASREEENRKSKEAGKKRRKVVDERENYRQSKREEADIRKADGAKHEKSTKKQIRTKTEK